MDDPANRAIFSDGEIAARVIPCHKPSKRVESDQPQADCFGSLLTVGHVDGNALTLREAHDPANAPMPRRVRRYPCHHGPRTMKPKPFSALYHFTVPFASTVARSAVEVIRGSLWSWTPRLLLQCGAAVHAEDLCNLRSLSGLGRRGPLASPRAARFRSRCAQRRSHAGKHRRNRRPARRNRTLCPGCTT